MIIVHWQRTREDWIVDDSGTLPRTRRWADGQLRCWQLSWRRLQIAVYSSELADLAITKFKAARLTSTID